MNLKPYILLVGAMISSITFSGCDKDDDNSIFNEPLLTETSNLSAPQLDKYLTYTDYDGVSFRVRFTNGGDIADNMTCKVHWRKYSSKQTKMPKESDMTEHETMRQYGSGTKRSTTFDKSHAGFTGGTYLYYYFECSNSRYTTESEVTYCVIKR